MNKKKENMYFVRLFIIPLSITIGSFLFSNITEVKSLINTFCVAFTLNWFADKTIIEWSIRRGQKLTKEKEEMEEKSS